jgi:protein-tyrosine phosphatase
MPNYDLSAHFDVSINFLNEWLNKTNVLVHCFAGISRSATITIAYLMKENKWSFLNAHAYVKERRGIIGPNMGFQNQLMNFEKQI